MSKRLSQLCQKKRELSDLSHKHYPPNIFISIKPGNDPVDPSQDKQTTSSSDHHKVTSFSPKQAVVNSEPSQSNYVCGKLPPTLTDNEVSRQWDPKMVVPRTNTTSLSDLPQLFPHLSKYQIEDWMRRDPRPHEMAFIGEGAVSSARDYKEPLEKPLPRVRAPQQDANSAVTTEPDSGQTVYPNDSDSSDNDSS